MKKSFKKVISVLLCGVIALSAMPTILFNNKAEAAVNWADIDFSITEYIAGIITNTDLDSCAISDDGKSIASMNLDFYTNPQNASLSKCYTEVLESDPEFMGSVAAWEVLTFTPQDIYNESLTEIGYYQAILFEILGVAVDYNFIPSIVEYSNKYIISTIAGINNLQIKLDDTVVNGNTQWSLLNAAQQNEIIQETSKHMRKLEMRGQDLSNITAIIETCKTVTDFVEKSSQLYALTTLTEDVKAVINELSANSSFLDNPEMETAIAEVKNAMVSKLESVGTIGMNLVCSGSKLAMDVFLGQMWGECLTAVLGGLGTGILLGQIIGRGLSNILFSTDEMIEQFYMMQALADFEKLMCKSVKTLGVKYASSQNSTNASVFLKSIDLLYNTYILDFEYTADFAEIIHEKGLINKIKLFATGESADLTRVNSIVASVKSSMANTLGMLTDLDNYSFYLEIDYPDVYAIFYKGMSYEDITNRYVKKVRALTVACPTDVDVYNFYDELVVSVKNNEVELCMPGYFCIVEDNVKYLIVSADSPSEIFITGTDEGEMTYSIYEADEYGFKRTMKFKNVELTKGCIYQADLPQNIRQTSEKYVLVSNVGEIIKPDFDTQPVIDTDITDIIVSEELYEGFSTELIDKVANAMFKFEPVVDITSYNILTEDTVALFSAISKYYPTEYSLVTKSDFEYKIIFSPSLGCITEIRFYYGDDANLEAFERRNKDLKDEINKIVARVEGMDDFEKALYIHDYIILNSEYDLELLELIESADGTLDGEIYNERYTEYSILINGTGICGSYALAYRALMNAAGVDCLYLSSRQMNHAWNMVKIKGEWYHVDCCWDDPVPDNYGDARRIYFLRNDKEIMELNHYSWVPGYYRSESNLYSDMPRNQNSKQKYDSGCWYISDRNGIFKTDRYGNNKETVLSINATSIEVENGDLYYSLNGNMFFYNQQTDNSIMAYSIPDFQYDIYSERVFVKNFDVEEEIITYYLLKYSSGESTCKKYTGTNQKDLYEKVKNIDLKQSKCELKVFDTMSLEVEIESDTENDYILSWISSDSSVASVSSDGTVRGNGSGTATITVSYGECKDSCEIVVTSDTQNGYCGENVTWEFIEETGLLLINGYGNMNDFILHENPWKKLNVLSVEIGSGVTSIGAKSFENMKLTKVTLGKNVKNINMNAFYGCDELTNIVLPDNLETVGEGAFAYCRKLDTVNFPSSLTEIGKNAFRECEKFTSVYIPQKVSEIGELAFSGIDCLKRFTVDPDNTSYKNDEFGVLYSKDGTRLICFPENNSTTEYLVSSNVLCVEDRAFYSCENIEKITFCGDLTTTGLYTFYGCKNLKEIIFEGSLQEIGSHSFYYCTSVETFYVPDEVTVLGDYSFSNCESLTEIRLPDSLKEIGNYCFENCKKLKEIQLPEKLERIGNGVFYSCNSVESLYIPNEVDFIQGFSGTDSFTVSISDFLGTIRDYNVYKIYTLNYEAEDFWKTNFGIQDSIMSTVGLEVEYLLSAQNPTFDCSELNYISVGSENSVFSSDENGVLFNKDKTVLIRMPRNSSVTEYVVPDSVVSIAFSAFENCDNLQKVTIPDSVTYIGNNSFAECDNLKSIAVPDTVDKIREGTFYNCSSLTQIDISDSVIEIHTEAFSNCESLSTVSIPQSVALLEYCAFSDCDNLEYVEFLGATVGDESFVNCNKLEEIVFSDNVTCISALAFADLPSLRKIVWSNNLQEIQSGAFKNCDSVSCVILDDSITNLGIGVFEDCDGIVAVSIGSGIAAIPERTFRDCDSLQSVLIPQTVTQLYATAFTKCDSLEKMAILNPSCTITRPGVFSSGYFDYVNGMSKKICTLWGYSGSTAEAFAEKTGGFVANFKSFTEEPHVHEFFAIEYDANETSENKQYHNICYCGFHDGELVSELFNCELGGFKGTRCAFCGLEQGETVEATQHKFVFKNETHGTCVNPGAEIYECSVCKHTDEILKVADEGHSYIETVTAPTCTEIGYTTATCEYCGENAMYDFAPMLGHDVTVTCTDADCKNCAKNEYSCSRCDYHEIIVDEESGLGEHKISVSVTDATCTVNGRTDRICVVCNELISSETIAAGGHIPGEWKTVNESTTESAGKKEQRCSVCSELLAQEEIPKIAVPVSGVELSEGKIEIVNKSTYRLNANISPDNADDQSVTWTSDDESIASVDENGVVTANALGNANITVTTTDGGFTASCAVTVVPREFNVTWVVDDERIVESFKEGSVITNPEPPEKEGYSFAGWTPGIPATMPDYDLEFTAIWSTNSYGAVFDANGGAWADGATEKMVLTQYNAKIDAPEAPEKQGYIFSCWTPEVGVMDDVNGKVFKAMWTASTDTTYTVETYTMNTLGEYEKAVQIFDGATDTTVNAEYKVEIGFALNEEKSVLSGTVAADNSLVLKVYLDRKTYSFTTVVDGVSETTEYFYGSIIVEPAVPSKIGHKFTGWGKEIPSTMPAEDITVEAEWKVNSYTVTWNVDGTETKTSVEYGAKIEIPKIPNKTGFEFIDWDNQIPEIMPANNLSFTAQFRCTASILIKNNNGSKSINYGETLKLTAITANIPSDAKIYWYVDGVKKGEGETFNVNFESGIKTVEVKLVDSNGNVLKDASDTEISDFEEVTVKSGFFQKIISFFKNLFGMNRTVVQAFKGII